MVPLIEWGYLDYQKDPEESERWFKIISRNDIRHTANIVVWEWHWSESFETLIYYVKERALSFFFIRLC